MIVLQTPFGNTVSQLLSALLSLMQSAIAPFILPVTLVVLAFAFGQGLSFFFPPRLRGFAFVGLFVFFLAIFFGFVSVTGWVH